MTTFSLEKTVLKNYRHTENAFLPKVATVPLIQGDGTLCKSLVKAGDIVSEGEVIGISMQDDGTKKASKIHSPVPGLVTGIISVMNYDGKKVPAIQIKLEGKFSYLGKKLPEKKWKDFSSEEIESILLESGIINSFICSKPECLGNQLDEKNRNAVIVRLFDEDPSRVTDSLISAFYFDKIRIAAKILANAVKTKNILYLIPSAKENPELAKTLESVFSAKNGNFLPKENASGKKNIAAGENAAFDDGLVGGETNGTANDAASVNPVMTEKKRENFNAEDFDDDGFTEDYLIENTKKYPYGTKREILLSVNRLFRKNIKFSISKNDLFIDSSSLLEVYDAVVLGIPFINKYVHLSGDCLYSSSLLQIKIGTKLKDIVNQLGGFNRTPGQVIINGLVCGTEVFDMDVPVTKNVKSIQFNSRYNFCDLNVFACKKCGNCRNVCPVNISPDILYNSMALDLHLSDVEKKSCGLCTDCGLCNTVCPSRLPLSQIISNLKNSNDKNEGQK